MFAIFRNARNPLVRIAALLSVIWLAACQPSGGPSGGPSIDVTQGVQVALLVPGGSTDAGDDLLAQSLVQAARLAIADLQGVKIDLRVYNTGADPALAAQMTNKAIDEGAKIILGPVFAGAANAAGVAAAKRNVNVLSFSNNADIAGGNVFILGPTFQNTANRLVRYAAAHGKRRILIVNDQTPAGEIGARAIQNAIVRSGATFSGKVSYPFSQQDIAAAVPGIASRVDAGDVDALFLTADAAGALPYLSQRLYETGVTPSKVGFLGLPRWDQPTATLSMPGMQGALFAMPATGVNLQFQSRYQAAYGSAPHSIAGLAYDGIAAIGALVRSGRPDALARSGLTQSAGFVGATGVFRLLPDGTNERALSIVEIRNGTTVELESAPRSFGGAGY